MWDVYARTMFSDAAKELQETAGSRQAYERMARSGRFEDGLSEFEREFIEARDSFYMGTVTPDGWPYIQHRGGPAGQPAVVCALLRPVGGFTHTRSRAVLKNGITHPVDCNIYHRQRNDHEGAAE